MSKISREDLLALYRYDGFEFVRNFEGRWCDMISVDWSTDEETWICRAMGEDTSVENMKILVLRREGLSLNRYRSTPPATGAWYKIAIEDTKTGDVHLRSFHNIPRAILSGEGSASVATSDGWFCRAGGRGPSTVGADKTFWLDLATVIGLN